MTTITAFLQENKIEYRENLLMSKKTTFRIGGPAAVTIYPKDMTEVCSIVRFLHQSGEKYLVLGNCSNVLPADCGISLPILFTDKLKAVSVDKNMLTCQAGILLSQAANTALENGLSGLAFAHGIPGTVGGAVRMNAGAYGGSISNVVHHTVYVDQYGEIKEINSREHGFGYRKSIFTDRDIIIETTFLLQKGNKEEIKAQMTEYAAKRKASQPLEFPSAGSVFKRPEGHYTGALVEQCGLKGYQIGGAQISEKHAGFIINKGGATAEDVKKLISHIQNTVFEHFGVMLETEIKFI